MVTMNDAPRAARARKRATRQAQQDRADEAQAQHTQEQTAKRNKRVREDEEKQAQARAEQKAQERVERARKAQRARFPGTDEDYLDPDEPQGSADRVAQQVLGRFNAHPSEDELSRAVKSAGARYMDSVKRRGFFASLIPKPQAYQEMSELHRAYCGVMGYTALAPLKEGFSAHSVVKSLSTAATMWALSPEFRSYVGESAQGSLNSLGSAVDSAIEKRRNAAWEKKSNVVGDKVARGENISDRWVKRLEKLKSKAEGRSMFTAESAAMTEVALMEDLYVNLRDPEVLGDDPEGMRAAMTERYTYLTDKLYQDAQRDGLSVDEVQAASRKLIGIRVMNDPSKITMYQELSQGQYYRTPAQPVKDAHGKTQMVWDGQFTNDLGEQATTGMFRVREPVSAEQHQVDMADRMAADLGMSGTPKELNERLLSYMVGSSEALSAEGMRLAPPERRVQFQRAQMMHTNMTEDGLSDEDQREAYASAFVEAIGDLPRVNPELAKAWNREYGSVQLLQDMGRMARDEQALRAHFISATSRKNPEQASPEYEDAKEGEADDQYTMG